MILVCGVWLVSKRYVHIQLLSELWGGLRAMGGDHELIVNEVYALYYFHLYHKAHISCLWGA